MPLRYALGMRPSLLLLLDISTIVQSLLFAAGLRPTPAQATAVSWVRLHPITYSNHSTLAIALLYFHLNRF